MDERKLESVCRFLYLAEKEYEALSQYCNSLSQLTHAFNEPKSNHNNNRSKNTETRPSSLSAHDGKDRHLGYIMDPNSFLKNTYILEYQNKQKAALLAYTNSLTTLQTIHKKLSQCHDTIVKVEKNCTVQAAPIHANSHYDNSNDHFDEFAKSISNHLGLSKRVLKTCASSMSAGFGPFYDNGMIKNLGGSNSGQESSILEDWHEIRIVAVTAYRGSIAQMKQLIASVN